MQGFRTIRTLIVDDECLIRGGLRAFLEVDRSIEIIGEAMNGMQAIQMTISYRPDIVILDTDLNDVGGLEVAQYIECAAPDARVICLQKPDKTIKVDDSLTYSKGSKGFISKGTTSQQLLEFIHFLMGDGVQAQPRSINALT